jgi:trans-aconitate methyltransferase
MIGFDRFAAKYEKLINEGVRVSGESAVYFAQQKVQYLSATVPAAFAGKVLDFGCGVGLVSAALADQFPAAELHGFDPSAASIARIPDFIRARGRFVDSMSALSSDYQLAIIANVLHHIAPADRPSTIASVVERLAPGGRLVVVEHNPWNPATRYIVATCALDEDAVLLRKREAMGLLRAAGMTIERTDYIAFFPSLLAPLRPLEGVLSRVPLGAQYAVVARR